MTKQVKEVVAPVPSEPEASASNDPQNLYISVKTFDIYGHTIGERVVDMCHFGTANWLYKKHLWWAMCRGFQVEVNPATDDEIDSYIIAGKAALARKFNGGDEIEHLREKAAGDAPEDKAAA